ncbi:hypothetical protein ACFY4C_41370 [Actinomadura viridis]|uniref:hypothetical protein n=1 Tax=Actinomadura viridis TaxID=58110 RepID=UPI00368D2807
MADGWGAMAKVPVAASFRGGRGRWAEGRTHEHLGSGAPDRARIIAITTVTITGMALRDTASQDRAGVLRAIAALVREFRP